MRKFLPLTLVLLLGGCVATEDIGGLANCKWYGSGFNVIKRCEPVPGEAVCYITDRGISCLAPPQPACN